MVSVHPSSWTRDETVPWLISGLGLAFFLAFVVETVYFSGLEPANLLTASAFVSFLFAVVDNAALVYGGYWLATSSLDGSRYARVLGWCLAGSVTLSSIDFLLTVVLPTPEPWITVGLLRGAATFGAAIGLLIGILEARAIQTAVEVERSSMRARYLEAQRDWLTYLNGLLRHEVLNTAQVVVGKADVLLAAEDLDAGTRPQLRAIRRQTEDMTSVIEDVRLLIDATREDVALEPVDLAAVLREELQDVRDTYDGVTLEVDIVEEATVWGDALLPRVFSNLLANAVEHNDSDEPVVTVEAELTDETAVVSVADDGPGVSPAEREDLFELETPTQSEPGLGLYVVSMLVDRYDGSIELTETGPRGSVFTVELPRVTAGDGRVPDGSNDDPAGDRTGTGGNAGAGDSSGDDVQADEQAAASPYVDGGRPDESARDPAR